MMAEFLEECFDIEELSGHAAGNFAKRVQEKLVSFNVSDLEPAFTGLAIDLLNLRTDVCGVLDLTGRRAVLDAFQLSWEYTHSEPLRRIEFDGISPALQRADFVQSGLGALALARAWLCELQATAGTP